jgi:hypothetical protein
LKTNRHIISCQFEPSRPTYREKYQAVENERTKLEVWLGNETEKLQGARQSDETREETKKEQNSE